MIRLRIHTTKSSPQHRGATHQAAGRLSTLLLARELPRVVLYDLLIRDIDGHHLDVGDYSVCHRLNIDGQQADLPGQHLSCPTAPSLQEELLRIAFGDKSAQILTDEGAVQLITAEATPYEEGSAAAEDGPKGPEAQIRTSSDVGRHHPLVIEQP